MALSSVELGTRNVNVIVSLVTPCPVAPPLSPEKAGVQLGEWPVQVNWRTFGPHFAPVLDSAPAGVPPPGAPLAPPVVLPVVLPAVTPAAGELAPPAGAEPTGPAAP